MQHHTITIEVPQIIHESEKAIKIRAWNRDGQRRDIWLPKPTERFPNGGITITQGTGCVTITMPRSLARQKDLLGRDWAFDPPTPRPMAAIHRAITIREVERAGLKADLRALLIGRPDLIPAYVQEAERAGRTVRRHTPAAIADAVVDARLPLKALHVELRRALKYEQIARTLDKVGATALDAALMRDADPVEQLAIPA